MNDPAIPKAFHVIAKPSGSVCNLSCAYCFYLTKRSLYPGGNLRMSDEVHDACIRQLLESQRTPCVTVVWQGGEPTLMGLDFFRRSIELQDIYRNPDTQIQNTLQTNGILLNDEWCKFLSTNHFLVGISLDGPGELHDFYRKDRGGRGTFERVMAGVRLLKKHKVQFNILCTVNSKNARYPLKVYRFFRDGIGANYIQFIPIVERSNQTGFPQDVTVTDRTVGSEQFGRFLIEIFDEWVGHDVGHISVLNFEEALAGWLGGAGIVCIFAPTCGLGVVLEHNGDLYSCDHFVEPDYFLGNILKTHVVEIVSSEKQQEFGKSKRDTLLQYCRGCGFLSVCNGGCPKNRFGVAPGGESGLNYLCAGYKAFFKHVDLPLSIMAELVCSGQSPAGVMQILSRTGPAISRDFVKAGRNDPCPCGSGDKFKRCHGRSTPSAPAFE